MRLVVHDEPEVESMPRAEAQGYVPVELDVRKGYSQLKWWTTEGCAHIDYLAWAGHM